MAITQHKTDFIKINFNLQTFGDSSDVNRKFAPFTRERGYFNDGIELRSEGINETQDIEIILEASETDTELIFAPISSVKFLTIKATMLEYKDTVQPDFTIKFNADTNQEFFMREFAYYQFSTGPTKIYLTNSTVYKMKIKIVVLGAQ